LTPGVNRLPPVGLTLFSVGAGGAVLDGDDVVVVVGRRRRCLVAIGAASSGKHTDDDEGCPGGQTNQVTTGAIRAHDECSCPCRYLEW
jgi:hypothetical protein